MAAKKHKPSGQDKIVFEKSDRTDTEVTIIGTTPLIVHDFNEKSLKEILEKQANRSGKIRKKLQPRDPFGEYVRSVKQLDNSGKSFGFPAQALKLGMIASSKKADAPPKTELRTSFFVYGLHSPEVVNLYGIPRMRMDMVRIGGINKVAQPRFRACFDEWVMKFKIRKGSGVSHNDVFMLLYLAGLYNGLGEQRGQTTGNIFGQFEVCNTDKELMKKAEKIIKLSEQQPPFNTEAMKQKWLNELDINFDFGDFEEGIIEEVPEEEEATA